LAALRQDVQREKSGRIHKRRQQVSAPLSFAQQRLWFIHQLEPDLCAYNFLLAARLKGEVNVAALERSFNEIIRRHETLRTSFTFADTQPLQVIAAEHKLTLPVVDLRAEPEERRAAVAERLMMEQVEQPFDLACGPLLRVKLLRLGQAEYLVVLVLHHIISDGWSMGVLLGEMGRLYEGFVAGRETELEELPIQYGDYAEWQRNWLSGAVLEEQLEYWRRQLAGMAALQLPTDRPRPPTQSFRGDYLVWKLPSFDTERLNSLSRQDGVTLFMTLTAAFAVVLHHLTEQIDIVIGTDVANRNHVQIEKLIGFFVNQLVLRFNLSGNPMFRELLKRTQRTTLEAYAHQELPFEMVVAALQPERQTSRMPLFQVKLVLQNYPLDQLELPGLVLTPVPTPIRTSKYDLLFNINENNQGLAGTLEYDTELFDAASISRLLRQYEAVLRQVVAQPEIRLTMLSRSLVECEEQHSTTEEKQLAETNLKKLKGIKRRPVG